MREEMENCIVDTLFECTHSGEDDTISDKEFAKVLADKFINHETNLLKEFVEWLKGQNCIIMQQDCAGTMKCDFALERFLEERK